MRLKRAAEDVLLRMAWQVYHTALFGIENLDEPILLQGAIIQNFVLLAFVYNTSCIIVSFRYYCIYSLAVLNSQEGRGLHYGILARG